MESHQQALALLATEWFKLARRTMRLAAEAAPHRLERERSQIQYSAGQIVEALAASGLRMSEHDGQPYSPGLPAEVLNVEDFATEEGLVVAETAEPTITCDGRILRRGKILLKKAQA